MARALVPEACWAWVWQSAHEALDLRLQTVAIKPLEAAEVLVRNAAIGLNPVDWKVLGHIDSWQPGHVPGVDGAGVVVAVGGAVPASWLGRRVAYHQNLHRPGSFAEYTPLAVQALMRVPDALDFATAASFPCPGLTAWQAIEKVPLQRNATLLISGAGGAVGCYLAQLAVERGFSVSTICHDRHWRRLSLLGVSRCFASPEALEGLSFYAVIDSVGPDRAARLAMRVEANGHLVCIQGRVPQWPFPAFEQAVSLHEVALGALHRHGRASAWAQLMAAGERMLEALSSGGMKPEAQVRRDFAELPEFLEALRLRSFSGKPVLLLPGS
jgi:NADPH2:quinone reductase